MLTNRGAPICPCWLVAQKKPGEVNKVLIKSTCFFLLLLPFQVPPFEVVGKHIFPTTKNGRRRGGEATIKRRKRERSKRETKMTRGGRARKGMRQRELLVSRKRAKNRPTENPKIDTPSSSLHSLIFPLSRPFQEESLQRLLMSQGKKTQACITEKHTETEKKTGCSTRKSNKRHLSKKRLSVGRGRVMGFFFLLVPRCDERWRNAFCMSERGMAAATRSFPENKRKKRRCGRTEFLADKNKKQPFLFLGVTAAPT